MNGTVRRSMAATAAALLLSVVGALTTLDTAGAVSVTWSSVGTAVNLDADETYAAVHDEYYATSSMCASALTQARQAGLYLSDWANLNCGEALIACAQDAYAHNRTLSGVRFYPESYICLFR